MPTPTAPLDRVLRLTAGLASVALLFEAARAASAAQLHMALLESVCGTAPADPHCGWCLAAASLGLAGVGALIFAVRTAPEVDADLSLVNAAF